ncbi:MAG: cell division protein FtsL [Candidatus Aminicenantes bacterium]|nr:MAG: cell division protein FtsL [Candidatus Aminicenantes bacterium]
MKAKKAKLPNGILVLITVIAFTLLFTYLSLNLKTIDFGYELQELTEYEQQLQEEIDKLKSHKARLLNLERVEKIVTRRLGYQYPSPDQFIKVFDYEGEDKR